MEPARILVVDDDPTVRLLVRACLPQHQISEAYNGEEGLHKALAERPDLMIVDWTMPKMGGDELCRAVRATPEIADMPLLMLTARREVDDEVEGLELGADDYIIKPFEPELLAARVDALLKRHERTKYMDPLMHVLGSWFSKHGIEQLGRELEVAREIQMGMLPRQWPRVPGLDVGAALVPASAVGGDFYDFFPRADGRRLAVVIGDVSGKGVPAALLMVMVRTMLRLLEREEREPLQIVRTLNQMLVAETSPDWFVTLCYVLLDPVAGTFWYANAGHCPLIVCRSDQEPEVIRNNGPALGIFPGEGFAVAERPLRPGDTLVAFTDGIVDVDPVARAEDRYQEIAALARAYADEGAAELAERLVSVSVDAASRHRDDLTALVAKVL
jgi:CheY-like chemotaxis protein